MNVTEIIIAVAIGAFVASIINKIQKYINHLKSPNNGTTTDDTDLCT